MLGQKPPILPDRIAAQWGFPFLTMVRKKFQRLLFSAPTVIRRGFGSIRQTGSLMMPSAPFIHGRKDILWMIYGYARTFSHKLQVIIGDDSGNL
jgi:hypothetical protein